jgi:hypothetical protein
MNWTSKHTLTCWVVDTSSRRLDLDMLLNAAVEVGRIKWSLCWLFRKDTLHQCGIWNTILAWTWNQSVSHSQRNGWQLSMLQFLSNSFLHTNYVTMSPVLYTLWYRILFEPAMSKFAMSIFVLVEASTNSTMNFGSWLWMLNKLICHISRCLFVDCSYKSIMKYIEFAAQC